MTDIPRSVLRILIEDHLTAKGYTPHQLRQAGFHHRVTTASDTFTPLMAAELAVIFSTTTDYWLDLHSAYLKSAADSWLETFKASPGALLPIESVVANAEAGAKANPKGRPRTGRIPTRKAFINGGSV